MFYIFRLFSFVYFFVFQKWWEILFSWNGLCFFQTFFTCEKLKKLFRCQELNLEVQNCCWIKDLDDRCIKTSSNFPITQISYSYFRAWLSERFLIGVHQSLFHRNKTTSFLRRVFLEKKLNILSVKKKKVCYRKTEKNKTKQKKLQPKMVKDLQA